MTDETIGGLPVVEPNIKATQPSTKGATVGGLKGVSLNPDQSTDIRAKLQQMIAEREGYGNTFAGFVDQLQSHAGPEQRQKYLTNERQRQQDILGMNVSMGELATEDARLAQAKALKASQDKQFFDLLNQGRPPQQPAAGGLPGVQPGATPTQAPMGGALPGAAPAPGPTAQAPMGGALPGAAPAHAPMGAPEPTAEMLSLYNLDPKAAITKMIEMRKMDETQRKLYAAGIKPGSPEWNSALMLNVAGTGAVTPFDTRTAAGTTQTTPIAAMSGVLGGGAQAPATAPVQAPAPAPAPAYVDRRQGLKPETTPVAAPPIQSPFNPGTKEDLEFRAAVAKEMASVPIAGEKEEATKMGATYAKQQETLDTAASVAPQNKLVADRITKNARAFPDVVGILGRPDMPSALRRLMQEGIQTPFGSVNIPSVSAISVQLDAEAAKIKDPQKRADRMTAYNELAKDFGYLQLNGSKVLQGQGSVSDNERALIRKVVGDFEILTPKNVLYIAKTLELEAINAKEQKALWDSESKRGVSWKEFKRSPEFKAQEEKQYRRTAHALGIKSEPPSASTPAAAPTGGGSALDQINALRGK